MEVKFNGERLSCATATRLNEFLESLAIPDEGTAICINQQLIPRSEWASYVLSANDEIDAVRGVQGG